MTETMITYIGYGLGIGVFAMFTFIVTGIVWASIDERRHKKAGDVRLRDLFNEHGGLPFWVERYGKDHLIYEIVRKCDFKAAYFGLDGLED